MSRREDTQVITTEEELEYCAHVIAITTVMNDDIDLFYEVNEEAGKHPSVMETEKWWEDLGTVLIGFEWVIDEYNRNDNLPAESQKEIHELILQTIESLHMFLITLVMLLLI